jgi:Rieske Fe-S protein
MTDVDLGRDDMTDDPDERPAPLTRRDLVSTGIAAGSVIVAGGFALAHGVRFLSPPISVRTRETFVAFATDVPEQGTLDAVLPDGRRVVVKRMDDGFAGFSNICPHLGCRVHWVPPQEGAADPHERNGHFRCPCHEGLFTSDGVAYSGPPADAHQSLTRVPLFQVGAAIYVRFEEEVS